MESVKSIKIGRHALVDFYGVDAKKLQDQDMLMNGLRLALKKGGFNVIRESVKHKFKGGGQGVTGFFLLAQSHAAFHTYPEYGYMAFDIYSCGKHDPKLIVEMMNGYLKPKKILHRQYRRGKINLSNSKVSCG